MGPVLGLFVYAAMVAPPQQAQPARERPDLLEIVLSEVERRIISEYYGRPLPEPVEEGRSKGRSGVKKQDEKEDKSGLPPGLAKREQLPPGLQRQLDERGRLPPGLQKRALPDDLARRLPKRGDGSEIAIVDRDVVLIQVATGIVLDAIAGIVD